MRNTENLIMGPSFIAQLPTLMPRTLISENLLRRVLVEVPEINNTELGSDIRTALTTPSERLVETVTP
ncbi:hypothetical protein [Paracoccus sp. (in: a-proteobacteria)]|uniref:hypothetical protein n=1 Tax=Paracoccus sp. TaxID=267 RepID=UPI00289BA87B|nr:hypothetical protein [Paracoccus sp. (in: a-proteobacteria)]